MAEKQKYTKEGFQKLNDEYEFLTKVKRDEVKRAIAEARNEQAKVEARIKELEELIQNAEVSNEEDVEEDVIGLGSFVKLLSNGREVEYSIVGSNEANPFENKISDMSVIGKSLLGKRAGDDVAVITNAGQVTIKVLDVSRAK